MAKIIGNTTATPNPQPDWAQTDSTKADYIKNKELVTDAIDDRAYKTTLSTDSTNSYIKDIPENSANYAKINSIGGMSIKKTSKNLLNVPDGTYNFSGQLTMGTAYGISDLPTITVPEDGWYVFDYKQKDVNEVSNNGLTGFEIGFFSEDLCYPRLQCQKGDILKLSHVTQADTLTATLYDMGVYKIENESSEVPDYEPYFEPYIESALVTEVESVGANLFNINAPHTTTAGGVYRYDIVGKPNTQYTFSTNVPQSNPTNIYVNGGSTTANGIYIGKNMTITTDENGYMYCEVRYSAIGDSIDVYTGMLDGTYWLMINKGATALPYTPFVKHTLLIPEAVQALDGYGLGTNAYYNYIEWTEDGKRLFNKNVVKFTFDGTEDWTAKSTNSGSVRFHYVTGQTFRFNGTKDSCISNKYDSVTTSDTWMDIDGICTRTANIEIKDNRFTNADDFKAYLAEQYAAGTPVECICVIQAEVIDISDILPADNYIEVEGGGTLTFKNGYDYDVPNSVDYYIGKNEYLAADKLIGTALRAESDADGNNIIDTYATKEELDELDERTECLKDTEGDNKILRSYQGKWYAVYPSLFAPQNTWYKGTTDKATITEINIVDTYTPTGEEAETWNADADNMGYIKCYVDNERAVTPVRFLLDQSTTIPAYPLVQGATYDSSMARLGLFRYYDSFDVKFDHSTGNLAIGDVTISFTRYNDIINFQSHNPGSDDYFYTRAGYDVVLTYGQTGETDPETGAPLEALFFHIIDENGALIESGNFYTQMSTSSITSMQITYTKDSVVSILPEGQTVKEEILDPGPLLIIAGNGYGKLSCYMDSLAMFMSFEKVIAINGANLLDTSSVVNMKDMFRDCKTLTTVDVSNWDTSNVSDMRQVFLRCYALTTIDVLNWDVSNVTTMKNMFKSCEALTTLDVSNWNVGNVTNMYYMFYSCYALTSLDVSNWNVGNVTDMKAMFLECYALTSLDVSNWNVGNVTDMQRMFMYCKALTTIDVSNWDVSNVTDMSGMFMECKALTTVDVSNWNVGNVTDMQRMFMYCKALTTVDVSNWDVGNVTDMSGMFNTASGQNAGDGKLVVDVSKWTPKSLEDADSMFYGNGAMTSIDLRNWNISKLKTMSHMFADCHNLTEVKLDGLVASSCISFNGMFNDCKSLVSIDLTGLVTDAAEEFQQMFEGCTALTEIKGLNTFVTTNAKAYHEMFYRASSLTELDLSSFRTEKLTTGIAYGRTGEENRYYPMTNMFTGMNKLQKVTFGDSFEFIEENYLPAPSADYIEGATGLWKNESTGATYTPADVPTKTAATYVAA